MKVRVRLAAQFDARFGDEPRLPRDAVHGGGFRGKGLGAGTRAAGPESLPFREASLGGFKLRKPAAFLLYQVELNPADRLRRGNNVLPRRHPLAEKYAIAFFVGLVPWRPILQVQALDPARIRVDPRDGVRPCFEAGAHVELQNKFLRRVRRDDVHHARATIER